jgi:hypothetical protein
MRDRTVGTLDVKQGEIYWVDVPAPPDTIGSEQYSRRPYLIVSRSNANRGNNTVVGIPFTASQKLLSKPYPQPPIESLSRREKSSKTWRSMAKSKMAAVQLVQPENCVSVCLKSSWLRLRPPDLGP